MVQLSDPYMTTGKAIALPGWAFVRNLMSLLSVHCLNDCSHEIKRRSLLGRKVMTNLDSILKSRDITLPTKVLIVKVMLFPVVIYGCES